MSLDKTEKATIHQLNEKLKYFQGKNSEKREYIEAKNELKEITKLTQVDFSQDTRTAVGLAGTSLDLITSRIKFRGVDLPVEETAVRRVLKENNVVDDSEILHYDALGYGVAFRVVGKGDTSIGEPSTLVTIESANTLTVNLNPRTRRITEALQVIYDEKGIPTYATLLMENENISLIAVNEGTNDKPEWAWEEYARDEHNKGFIPVIPFRYLKSTTDVGGRSLVTPVVMSCVDSIQRTNFLLELTRDFYGIPQKVFVGGQDLRGNKAWKAYIDVMLAVGYTAVSKDNGDTEYLKPDIKQFAGQSPAPLIELNRETTRQLSVETKIPQTYFGIQYANPASEGATRIGEASMIATCESIQRSFTSSYKTLIKYIAAFEYEVVPEWVNDVNVNWGDPAILTKEGERDYIMDLADRGIIQKDSDFLFDTLNIGQAVREQIRQENAAAEAASLINTLQTMATSAEAQALANMNSEGGSSEPTNIVNIEKMEELKLQFDALGVAVRAGVDPEEAAKIIGLTGIKMSGLQPTTLKSPESNRPAVEE